MVPFPAGGGNDALARVVAEKMFRTLGQQVVVENRGGAGGTIATRAVAKGTPDGYTILLTYTGTLYINPTLYPNAGYDPRKVNWSLYFRRCWKTRCASSGPSSEICCCTRKARFGSLPFRVAAMHDAPSVLEELRRRER